MQNPGHAEKRRADAPALLNTFPGEQYRDFTARWNVKTAMY